MKTTLRVIMIFLLGFIMTMAPCHAQKKKIDFTKGKSLLNKVKTLTEPEEKSSPDQPEPNDKIYRNEGEPKVRKLTPPDVNEQISNARAAFADNSYTEARFYVQQAIVGIELQIGYKILESMPIDVLGVSADKSQDEVFSAGAGFVGMNVNREYPNEAGTIKAIVANNSGENMGVQMAVSSPTMSGYDENIKITRYKGYKAVIEVDDYSGYKISIPFGQSSVFMLKCGTCDTEEQLMEAANLFDIDTYKNLLGEK